MFAHGQYLPAEAAFNHFIVNYTNSTLRTNAILYLARSRIELSNYTGALELLQQEMPAGKLAPDFVYWMAKAYYGKREYTNAIERCAYLLQNFPADPPLPLRASSPAGAGAGQIDELAGCDRSFVQARRRVPSRRPRRAGRPGCGGRIFSVGRGLFGESRTRRRKRSSARIDTNSLTLDLKWQRQYLLCRVLLEEGRLEEALAGSTNLLAFMPPASRTSASPPAFLRGEIFERTNQIAEALQAYANNLDEGIPPEVKRQALAQND